mmetsp:Transcript_29906/g.74315  ORF Transcript_29906/g.74315 Transcript_29906/m.74315 type:complete len:224 (-) Transcript_29906:980-1651(-)
MRLPGIMMLSSPSPLLMLLPMTSAPASPKPTCRRPPILMMVCSSMDVSSWGPFFFFRFFLEESSSYSSILTTSGFLRGSSASCLIMLTIFSIGAITNACVSFEKSIASVPRRKQMNTVCAMFHRASLVLLMRVLNLAYAVSALQLCAFSQKKGEYDTVSNSASRHGQSLGSTPRHSHSSCRFEPRRHFLSSSVGSHVLVSESPSLSYTVATTRSMSVMRPPCR